MTDIANLSLLKLYYPQIYQAVREDDRTYFTLDGNRYILYIKPEKETRDDILKSLLEGKKRDLLADNDLMCNIPDKQKDNLKELLERLFPRYSNNVPQKSISNYFYFKRYFYNALQDYDMSDNEFAALLKLNEDGWKAYINQNLSSKGVAFCKQIEYYRANNEDELLKVLRMVFYAGSVSNEDVRIFPDVIYKLLGNLNNTIIPTFIDQLFSENGASHFVCSLILLTRSHYVRYDWNEFIDDVQKQKYLNKMLDYAIKSNLSSENIYKFYSNTQILSDDGNYIDDKDALCIFKQAYMMRPIEFFPNAIWSQHAPFDNLKTWYLSPRIEKMWNGDWNAFEADFNKLGQNDKLDEFYHFYKKWKDEGMQPIEFDFHFIKKS